MHELKILEQDDSQAVIGGYGVVFGGVDLDGETFTAETDFMLDLVPRKLVYIDHSEATFTTDDGKRIKLTAIDDPVGEVLEVTPDDVGLYMRLQIDKANRYWNIVEQMLATGKAGLSSGTIGHLARRKGSEITRWPIVEESITLTPAEPRTVAGVTRLKHLVEANPELEAIVTEADGTPAVGDAATDEAEANQIETTIQIVESDDMAEETQAKVAALTEKVDGLSDSLNKIMEVMENSPALKCAGYTTDDGGAADETHKSFGDFLLAIKRRDAKRLAQVYKAQRDDGDTKDMAEAAGASPPLVGRRPGNAHRGQASHPGADRVTGHPREAGIDHHPDSFDRQAGLGDGGREHHLPATRRAGTVRHTGRGQRA